MNFLIKHWIEVVIMAVCASALIYIATSQISTKEDVLRETENSFAGTDIQESESRAKALKELETVRLLLSSTQNPTEEQQDQYVSASRSAIDAIRHAIKLNESNPENWDILGQIYDELSKAGLNDAEANAKNAYDERDRLKQI